MGLARLRKNIAAALSFLWDLIVEQYRRTSILILTISVCTLIVAFCGYRLQRNANEPELASAGPTITMWPDKPKEPKVVVLDFINIGKKPGRLGEAYCVVPGSSICSCAPAFEA